MITSESGENDGIFQREDSFLDTRPSITLTIETTQEQYDQAISFANSVVNTNFNYGAGYNCTDFVQQIYTMARSDTDPMEWGQLFTATGAVRISTLPIALFIPDLRDVPLIDMSDAPSTWQEFIDALEAMCFPPSTLITMIDGTQKHIKDIIIGDEVLSFKKDGNLVEGIVDKLFRNTTQEWINLSFDDGRDDLTATPGHRFLTETGDFMEIGHMVRLGGGSVRLVEKDGSIIEARAELLTYSSETAHLFDEAESRATIFDGNLAVKHDAEAGWATYNFEVCETHTYIANDIRVHNRSILAQFTEGDSIFSLNENFTDMAISRDINGDQLR